MRKIYSVTLQVTQDKEHQNPQDWHWDQFLLGPDVKLISVTDVTPVSADPRQLSLFPQERQP